MCRFSGISIKIGMDRPSQNFFTARSPISERLITTPDGMPSSWTTSTASSRSLRPNGVGSVTRMQKSLPFIDAITGQEVPGGESMMTTPLTLARARAALMSGGDMASPTVRRPWTKPIGRTMPCSKIPMDFGISEIACSGHTLLQPPQPWQSSGKTSTFSFTTTMALKLQIVAHSPQYVHLSRSTCGRGIETFSLFIMCGFKKR